MEETKALKAKFALIHVMGPHGRETVDQIFRRKTDDIVRRGSKFTLWAHQSRLATPEQVKKLCKRGTTYLYFVGDGIKAPRWAGVEPKTLPVSATHYASPSGDSKRWKAISRLRIGKVTGEGRALLAGRGYAIAIGKIHWLKVPKAIRMEEWADVTESKYRPVRTGMGRHIVCARRRDMRKHPEVWIKERRIFAVARVLWPYSVWLKANRPS